MLNIDDIRTYCSKKKGVTEDFPFDETTLCIRVMNKIFLITDIHDYPLSLNLKNNPEKVIELIEGYEAITPGYHMNKKHWITINIDDSLDKKFIFELIDDSYNQVILKLTKKEKDILKSI